MTYPIEERAKKIWTAGLEAVRSDRLIQNHLHLEDGVLKIAPFEIPIDEIGQICVVGAGKAGAGMAFGLEKALAPLKEKISGWVNVPEGCERDLECIHLHPARPAHLNEPTEAGITGSKRIMKMVQGLSERDICICLLSGGGSALLPLPADGVTLTDLQQVTRQLSGAGADIQQLNAVRRHLSRIKGGGLASACRAGTLITLIISDVIGDPLEAIASGPTVFTTSDINAMDVLERYAIDSELAKRLAPVLGTPKVVGSFLGHSKIQVIGNNHTAVAAAEQVATQFGYETQVFAPESPDTSAEQVAQILLERMTRSQKRKACFLWGGEPIVQLAPKDIRGKGGRNQQLVLAALCSFVKSDDTAWLHHGTLLSAGTDGEDGPTDAAGAIIGPSTLAALNSGRFLDPEEDLAKNNAYGFFEQVDGLFFTGPTNTNVCDLRIAIIDKS